MSPRSIEMVRGIVSFRGEELTRRKPNWNRIYVLYDCDVSLVLWARPAGRKEDTSTHLINVLFLIQNYDGNFSEEMIENGSRLNWIGDQVWDENILIKMI